jgi:hypothetical protein
VAGPKQAQRGVAFPPANRVARVHYVQMGQQTSLFEISAIPTELLGRVYASRTDASGNPVVEVTATGGEPLRCCLRDALADEDLLLFGYEPPLPTSPYREVGAIFTHAAPCGGPVTKTTYPSGWRGRPQVLRAYDQRGWISGGRLHDGTGPEAVIMELFENKEVVELHSRNVEFGCYMFLVRRSSPSRDEAREELTAQER